MKKINKYLIGILFFFGFLLAGATIANADTITGDVTITVNPAVLPTLTTTAVTSITQSTATSGGNITSDGGATVTARGVLWVAGNVAPTMDNFDDITTDGTGIGSFASTIARLSPGTLYSVRAYATNSAGTAYGSVLTFTTLPPAVCTAPQNVTVSCDPQNGMAAISGSVIRTPNQSSYPGCTISSSPFTTSNSVYVSDTCRYLPIVTSPTCTNITPTSVTIGANVTFMGVPNATAGGMCIDTSTGTTGCSTSGISSIGPITRNVTGLTPNTTYYYKGNAINSAGTGWSTTGSCKTAALLPTGTLTPSSISCIIPTGSNTCNASVSWTLNNPASITTAISAVDMDDIILPTNMDASQHGTQSVPIPYTESPLKFYLFNHEAQLGSTVIGTSDCDLTTDEWVWDSTGTDGVCARVVTATAGANGTISPSSKIITSNNSKATFTVTPNSGYAVDTMGGTCGVGTLSGTTYTTPTIARSCTVTASFKNIVTLTVTASPATYNTNTNTTVPFTYTPTINSGSVECRLLDNTGTKDFDGTGLTNWTLNTNNIVNTINYASPSGGGVYGYFVQCRSSSNTTIKAISNPITVNVIQPSVIASPLTYNVLPGATVPFTYTASTIPVGIGSVECKLVDYAEPTPGELVPASAYQANGPISYKIPSSAGSYGYHVKCRNTAVNAATTISSKIIVNALCGSGDWNGSSCVCPAPLTQNITGVICDPHDGVEAISGSVTQIQTKDLYPGCAWKTPEWVSDTCVYPPATGTLNATTCGGGGVPLGGGSCQITLSWDVKNGKTGVYPTIKDITNNKNITITSVFNGTVNYNINLGNTSSKSTDFELWYGDSTSPLAEASAIASCSNSKTKVVGGKCILKDAEITSFTPNPATIFKGKTSVLTWVTDSELVASCTIKSSTLGEIVNTQNKANGSVTVTPKVNTTYTLTCISVKNDGSPNASMTTTTKVVDVIIKEN